MTSSLGLAKKASLSLRLNRRNGGACKRTEERGCSDEQDRAAVLDSRAAEGDGEMTLADIRWPEQQHVFGVGDEATGRHLANAPLVQRRLELEVEVVERLHRRGVSNLHPIAMLRSLDDTRVQDVAHDASPAMEVARSSTWLLISRAGWIAPGRGPFRRPRGRLRSP